MLNIKNFVFWILLSLILVKASSIYEQKRYKRYTDSEDLYSDKDDVEILTIENFKTKIYGNKRAWIIEFYSPWCGSCLKFAPSWKALATDVRNWTDFIAIGVLDCTNDDNSQICRNFEVIAYPTLRYFHENYQEGSTNFGIQVRVGSGVNEQRQTLLEVIVQEQNEGRGKMYPNLLPYNSSNVSQLYELVPENVKYIFLIVQEPSQLLGQEVTMDLHHINDFIVRYAFNNNSELVNALNVNKFPALFAIGKDASPQKLNTKTSDREGIKIAIHSFLIPKPKHIHVPINGTKKQMYKGKGKCKWTHAQVPDMTAFMQEREKDALRDKVKKMGDVFKINLETALRYSLKCEVGSVKKITGKKLKALKAYINILVDYFPFGKLGQAFLVELKDYIANEKTIKGSDIREMVKYAEDDQPVFSSSQQWLGCKRSSSSFRGYPCDIWEMFYYLTVNATDSSSGLKDSNPKVVLKAIHGYKNLFGCVNCNNHCQKMAKKRKLGKVRSKDDSKCTQCHDKDNS